MGREAIALYTVSTYNGHFDEGYVKLAGESLEMPLAYTLEKHCKKLAADIDMADIGQRLRAVVVIGAFGHQKAAQIPAAACVLLLLCNGLSLR